MIETELKLTLDAAAMARAAAHPALDLMRSVPRRSEALLSVYYDTPDLALKAAGVSLRLRKVGRRWVQTIKRKVAGETANGLFANRESERPAPGGRLVLTGTDEDGALAAVREAAGEAMLAPVFETAVRRITERLGSPGGGVVEMALDDGEIRAGEARAPILEAEFELVSGTVGDVYDVAQRIFEGTPVRFAGSNKAARGYRLLKGDGPEPAPGPRKAGTIPVDPEATVETVVRDILRDCQAQVAANMAEVMETDAVEGPHQLRIGLRRLRTAFGLFAPSLGPEAVKPLADVAQRLGQVVGQLRDADVLLDEVVADTIVGVDDPARVALTAALQEARVAARVEVRTALAQPEAAAFPFVLGRFIEGRGWLVPTDYSQTERLATPIAGLATEILDRNLARVMKRGRRIRRLDAEGLHELRKTLKKLRYAVEMLGPLYPDGKVAAYLEPLKELQDSFGSLNDAAMAEEKLTGAEAPAHGDPAAQRGVGWVLGVLSVRVADDRPKLYSRWRHLEAAKPFWR